MLYLCPLATSHHRKNMNYLRPIWPSTLAPAQEAPMNQDMALPCINEQGALGDGGWSQVREGGEGRADKVLGHVAGNTRQQETSF